MLRRVIAVVAGCALWMFLFYAVGIGFGLIWPAYAEAARFMMQESDLSHFTTPMLFLNWALFVIDESGTIVWSYCSPIAVNPGADGILDALETLPPMEKTDGTAEGSRNAA